jgi:cytochrome P450
MAFNTGPRSCVGKNIAVPQITSIIATMVWNFDFEVLERQMVKPKLSIVMQMKNGLKVIVNKRQGI